jgi:hypothetical protein
MGSAASGLVASVPTAAGTTAAKSRPRIRVREVIAAMAADDRPGPRQCEVKRAGRQPAQQRSGREDRCPGGERDAPAEPVGERAGG